MARKPPHEISVRKETFDKLAAFAKERGQKVGPTLDKIVTDWLDSIADAERAS